MSELARFPLRLRFSGPEVDKIGVDLYDGATSFQGFSQALQIALHAYMSKKIVSRATALKGAQIYFGAPKHGSIIFDFITLIEKYPATTALLSTGPFYDFIKYSLSKAIGHFSVTPETPSIRKLIEEDETFFDFLAENLEGSLQRAHRAVDNGVPQITLERPRSALIRFDSTSSEWVNTREVSATAFEFTGNVTRYNSISTNGRAYIRELGRVIPFRLAPKFLDNKRGLLTWSLHGDTTAGLKDLKIWANRVESAQGEVKRLLFIDCVQA